VLQAPVDGEVRGSPVGQEQLERVPEQEGQARSVAVANPLPPLLSAQRVTGQRITMLCPILLANKEGILIKKAEVYSIVVVAVACTSNININRVLADPCQ
jgi:hypothetical protein